MRPYDDFAAEVRDRQAEARRWASRRPLRRGELAPASTGARLRLAAGLRRLARWVEGPGAVTLRPS